MTGPNFLDDPRMARVFGLTPEAKGPAQASPPQPMNIPAVEQEMAAWLHRGGQTDPKQLRDMGIDPNGPDYKYPGGSFGGEFSDQELASYLDAAKKLANAKSQQEMYAHVRDLKALAAAKPDALPTNRKAP